MHDGFAGGAFIDPVGRLMGVTTATEIRGLGVVIPASIAWKTAATVLEHGRIKRGYLGLAGQRVQLGSGQSGADAGDDGHAFARVGRRTGRLVSRRPPVMVGHSLRE